MILLTCITTQVIILQMESNKKSTKDVLCCLTKPLPKRTTPIQDRIIQIIFTINLIGMIIMRKKITLTKSLLTQRTNLI